MVVAGGDSAVVDGTEGVVEAPSGGKGGGKAVVVAVVVVGGDFAVVDGTEGVGEAPSGGKGGGKAVVAGGDRAVVDDLFSRKNFSS